MLFASRSPSFLRRLGYVALSTVAITGAMIPFGERTSPAIAQTAPGQALTLRADVQEANAVTGVVTARGNVQIFYPARQIQATSVQAQYYSRERRIVLSGNVYVLQQGNSLRAETITYLIDEGRFVATPDSGQQVQSIYIVDDPNPPAASPAAASPEGNPDYNPKPDFKTPISPETP